MIAASCMERGRTEIAVNVGGAQGVVTLKLRAQRGNFLVLFPDGTWG